jgi:hypothetical protein
MKTISRTNRPQNKYIAFSLFLLIAIFGLFIGGVKPPTGDVTQTSIGGNGSVSVPPPTPFAVMTGAKNGCQRVPADQDLLNFESADIGGQRVPGDGSPLGISNLVAIGGQNSPGPETRALTESTGGVPSISNVLQIGGNGSATPSPTLPGISYQDNEIGGQQTPPHSLSNIGGQGIETRNVSYSKTIKIGGNSAPRGYVLNEDIGGNSTPQENRSFHCTENIAIGGNQGAPQVPGLPFVSQQYSEIGGNGTPRPTLPLIGFAPQEQSAIGGNQSVPHVPLPLAKNVGKSTASLHLTLQPNCKRNYSMFDFNQDFALMDLEEIGGGQTVPREKEDIGGTQTVPRP